MVPLRHHLIPLRRSGHQSLQDGQYLTFVVPHVTLSLIREQRVNLAPPF